MVKMDLCVFCSKLLGNEEPIVTLRQKGCKNIRKASIARESKIKTVPGQKVHIRCRQEYINPKAISTHKRKRTTSTNAHFLRSSETFDYETNCIFCGFPDPYDGRKQEYSLISGRSTELRDSILQACKKYDNHDWVKIAMPRFLYALDLPSASVVYHRQCSVNFRTGRQIPKLFLSRHGDEEKAAKRAKIIGRPKDEVRREAFLQVAKYLEENDDEQITINDLINQMQTLTAEENCEPYSSPYMKQELKKHYGDRIIVTEINGKPNVVTFHSTANRILNDFHDKKLQHSKDVKLQIIEAAAQLIKSDIKDIKQSRDIYPSNAEISSIEAAMAFIPPSLQTFLKLVFSGGEVDLKIASIGQAIMQSARPRVLLAPMQLALGVQMHHHFQSRFLIESLHRLGFCCSYPDIKKYERSAAMMEYETPTRYDPKPFIQYAADNVDYNIRTLDGRNSFHGMGMIASFTPRTKTDALIKP